MVVEDLPGDVKSAEVGAQKRAENRLPALGRGKWDSEDDEENRQHQDRDLANVILMQTPLDEVPHAISPFVLLGAP